MGSIDPAQQTALKGVFLAAGSYCVLLLLLYYPTLWSMVSIWLRSETFTHGFLVMPISLWLVWIQRDQLRDIVASPLPSVTLLLLPVGCIWLAAWLVDILVVQQLCLVAMLVIGVWAVLGHPMTAAIIFPLGFLFFAVPIGERLIPPMMDFTATSTVWLIRASGIPVHREGLMFSLPSGNWSVVEACSGVRYIIASATVGVLYAWLTYRSWPRRILFVIASLILPALANSVRAYIIVMLGHFSNMQIATGADHLVYGWLFFGVVIFLLFWLGSFFREDHQPAAKTKPIDYFDGSCGSSIKKAWFTAALALVAASVAPAITSQLRGVGSESSVPDDLPVDAGGWHGLPLDVLAWSPPTWAGGQHRAEYAKGARKVKLYLQYADGSDPGAEVIGSNRIFVLEEDAVRVLSIERASVDLRGERVLVDEALLRANERNMLAWSWYRIGTLSTAVDHKAKLEQMRQYLGWAPGGMYRIIVILEPGAPDSESRAALQDFVEHVVVGLYDELDRMNGSLK